MNRQRRRARFAREALVGLGVLGALAGCSAVLGIESDRHLVTNDDAGNANQQDTSTPVIDAGPDVPPAPKGWECINDPVPDAAVGDVQVKLIFNDVSSSSAGSQGKPIVGATLHACNKLDYGCANGFSDATSDDGGVALLTVPSGFDGFYEVHANGYTPALLSRTPQILSESEGQGMANVSLLAAGGSLAGVTQDTNLSIAIVTALDCSTTPAEGIIFEVGSPTANEQVVYLENRLPSKSATQTDLQSGSALVFNVPAGTLTITAKFAADQRPIRTVSTIARQGWVTFVQLRLDQSTRAPL